MVFIVILIHLLILQVCLSYQFYNSEKFGINHSTMFAPSTKILSSTFSKLRPRSMSLSMSTVTETTQSAIRDNTIMVFAKSYCPHSKKAKAALDDLNLKYGLMELDVSYNWPKGLFFTVRNCPFLTFFFNYFK